MEENYDELIEEMSEISNPLQKLKAQLCSNFEGHKTYLGSFVRNQINGISFSKAIRTKSHYPDYLKKGDVVIYGKTDSKRRPAVIAKVFSDYCVLIPLTSSENVHNLIPAKSRFFKYGHFCKSFDVMSNEMAIENFAGVFDNPKNLNKAIEAIKQFITTAL